MGVRKVPREGKATPGPGKPDEKNDMDRDRYQKEDKSRKSSGKFDRFGKIDKESGSGHEGSMEEEMEQRELDDVSKNSKSNNIPLAAFHPNMGTIPIHSPTVSKWPI